MIMFRAHLKYSPKFIYIVLGMFGLCINLDQWEGNIRWGIEREPEFGRNTFHLGFIEFIRFLK